MIKLGVDNGNYNTKTSEGLLYASGFAVSDTPTISVENQLEYGGKFYSIGEGRMNVQNDKTVDDDVFILTLPAIAHAMNKEGVSSAEIALGVGLPITLFGAQREKFQQYFMRNNIEFVYGGKNYHVNIPICQAFPQGYAAIIKYFALAKSYSALTLVDIGGYTVDIMQCRHGKPDKRACRSLPIGTITLFNNIKNDLLTESISLTDCQITDGIFGRIEHLRRQVISAAIKKRCDEYMKQLFNALRELGIDLQMPTIFAGGGSEIFTEYLYSNEIHLVDILDRFANAEGFKLLLG